MIVEKYSKALIQALNEEELVEVYEAVAKIALISKDPKFILLIKSPLISIEDKVKILSELADCKNPKFINFMRIVLENKRVDILKDIHKRLYAKVSEIKNTYAGFVEGKIDNETLKALEEKLAKKFNATIKLYLKEKDLNGIKVFVDVLNVEFALVEERIKQDIISQILKAI